MWGDYRPRQSVEELRRAAEKKVRQLKIDGIDPHPITGIGRTGKIAKSFWGHGWCQHLEQHCDYESRLPRGRSYVRNGAVVHLDIDPGEVNALVLGSELYELSIRFDPLSAEKWASIQADCRGKIGSLIELLQGKLSEEVMERVTHPEKGLFPQIGEIHLSCNCPDWADMCKHIAAALYGIGARLDAEPELLFRLRGVDHRELVDTGSAADNLVAGSRGSRRRTLNTSMVSDIFGIEPDGLEEEKDSPQIDEPEVGKPATITGPVLRSLRESIGLNKTSFGQQLGVSPTTITNWERKKGPLRLSADQEKFLLGLEEDS